jgi:hypothetical protein
MERKLTQLGRRSNVGAVGSAIEIVGQPVRVKVQLLLQDAMDFGQLVH